MNRFCLLPYSRSAQGTRPRLLVLAVLAALPGVLYAQEAGVPTPSQSAPSLGQSTPAAGATPRAEAKPAEEPPVSVVQPRGPSFRKAMPMAKSAPQKSTRDPGITVIEAGRIDGRDQVDMTAVENVRLERGDLVLTSDQLHYDQVSSEVQAEGNVKLVRGVDVIEGPRGQVNLDTWQGDFDSPRYQLQRERKINLDHYSSAARPDQPMTEIISGSGTADLLKLEGENHYHLKNATYTTCPAPDPSWFLRMSELELDMDRDKGEAKHGRLIFKDVPIAYFPWAEFPLSGGRQSGFLPPTVGGGSTTGFETTVPYYFNLAPNYDATLAPRWMSDRGLQLGGQARYLTSKLNGIVRGEYLSNDSQTQTTRSLLAVQHNQDFGYGLTGVVDVAQVSDKTYFADLSSKIGLTSQSTLNQQATLNYNSGSWLSGSLLAQRYQVLSGSAPYERRPALSVVAKQADFHGLALAAPASYTDFGSPTQDEGQRSTLYPQVSLPLQSSAFYVTPKVGTHLTHYDLQRRTTTGAASVDRSVPMASVDAGVVFERETTYGERAQIHTLEPRIYYVRTAYRDQSQIPVFDSGKADFNFAQIFSENRYSGQDRIADANQLTGGLQSRLIDSATGEEWMRMALAQRYYFEDQKVMLPGETPRSGKVANVLGGLSGRVQRDIWMDNTLQYDPRVGLWERVTTGARYQPDFGKVFSASYRYERNNFRDIDFSAQWPLWGGWYGVGRFDKNMRDHRLSEGIAGLEYKADCWVFRGVWQTLLTTPQTATAGEATQTRSNSWFLQIEFNGLASIGSNPVNLLKRSVNGYGKINDPAVGNPMFGDSAQP